MSARAGRLIGAALVWTVLGVAIVVGFVVCLPLFFVAGVLRGLYEVGKVLIRRGEMSAADDLDDVLRAEIDGDGEAYRPEFLDESNVLRCGCRPIESEVARCPRCDWVTCVGHAGAPHLCERDAVVEAFNTNPRNTPVGGDFAAWESECAGLSRLARKLGGQR